MAPVVTGVVAPIEGRINSILDIVQIIPIVGETLPRLNTDVSGLLGGAAAGAPITLQVFDRNGNAIGPADQCNLQADTLSLATPRGLSIGGNRITGLGADGAFANAADLNAIAFGNGAATSAAATGSIAIGQNAAVTAANSVAIGAGASASRGPQLAYAALGLDDDQTSAGEFSVGAAGARRQITNVAAGSAADDAVNVAQLQGIADDVQQVADDVSQLAASAVVYDGAAHDRITLAGVGGTVIANVAPGQIAVGSTEAVNGDQLFATNQNVAAIDGRVADNATAIAGHESLLAAQDSRISANTTQLATHDARITVLEARPIGGDGASAPLRYADGAGLPNDGTPSDDAVLVGASGGAVRLHNVAAGALSAQSVDAVNGAQLYATNQNVEANSIAITNLYGELGASNIMLSGLSLRTDDLARLAEGAVRYDGAARDRITLAGASGSLIANLAPGQIAAGSSEAVNGGQLFATNQNVAFLDGRITLLEARPIGGAAPAPGPLRYADAGTGLPNDGSPSDDAVLVGASGGAVRVRNVAAGALADNSSEAVNGAQLHATNQGVQANGIAITNLSSQFGAFDALLASLNVQVANHTTAIANLSIAVGAAAGGPSPVRYADAGQPTVPNGGAPSDHVTLVGASGGPVTLHNVADGRVEAGSTDAVNGGQLHTTNQAVANALAMAESATMVAGNSVQYDPGRASVTFAGGGAPVVLHNVAAGVAPTDAVNLGQLDAGLGGAVAQANAYTDLRIELLGRDLGQLRRDSNAGAANALAAAALPQAVDAGRGMVAFGTSYYQGQSAFALGLSARSDDGQAVFRAGASVDTRGRAGLNAGVGFQFQ